MKDFQNKKLERGIDTIALLLQFTEGGERHGREGPDL